MPDNLSSSEPATIRDQVSCDEWKTRIDLAAFYRLIDHYGWIDLIYNHVTARIPGCPDRYLVNPFGLMFEEITASSLITADIVSGQVLVKGNSGCQPNVAAHGLHASILAARPDIACIAHVHTPEIMAVCSMRDGLLPLTQTALNFHGRIGYHEYGFDDAACDRLVRDFGQNDLVILRNHGVLLGAPSIQEAFIQLHNFEFACRAQVQALACATDLVVPDEEVIREHMKTLEGWANRPGGPRDPEGCHEWQACLRMLARRGARYDI